MEAKNKKILASVADRPYFSKGNFVLYNADCLKIMAQLPENSIDMIFADPPYFLSSGSFTCQNGKMVSVKKGDWDLSNGIKKNFEFHHTWIGACRRGKMHNGIDFAGNKNEIRYIMPYESELRMAGQMSEIIRTAGDEIIHADHIMPFKKKAVA